MNILLAGAYGLADLFKERLFVFLRKRSDPNFESEEFDVVALGKWTKFENVFYLLLFLVLWVPAWWSMQSSWSFLLALSLPKLRRKATLAKKLYKSFELGYRCSMVVQGVKERNWMNVLLNAACEYGLFMSWGNDKAEAFVLGLLVLRQLIALWQMLYTVLDADAFGVDRRYFSLFLNAVQFLVVAGGTLRSKEVLFSFPFLALMPLLFCSQTARAIYGFFRK